MITYEQLLVACLHEAELRTRMDSTARERQLAQALRLYRERGEYDGTPVSARACLLQAGYEVASLIRPDGAK